jgi:hypothetical protein
MQASIISADGHRIVIQIEVDTAACHDLVDCEEAIQEVLNEAGTLATAEVLKRFDTDGQPIMRGERRWTSKGQIPKHYETPYGTAEVPRNVYQDSRGGKTYCPLDERAGIVLSATPRFARMIASKYAEFGSSRVQEDMAENHGRHFSRGYVSKLAEEVAAIVESRSEQTIYRLPDFDAPTETLVVALDEIDIAAFRPTPARVAIGSIGFYDGRGQRQYIVYLSDILQSEKSPDASAPDPGRFLARMEAELTRARTATASHSSIVAISGGHSWSTEFLQRWATVQFIDPVKATDMLSDAATVYFDRGWTPEGLEGDPQDLEARRRWEKRRWLEDARNRILSTDGRAALLRQFDGWIRDLRDDPAGAAIANVRESLAREHDAGRMNYQDPRASHVFANAGILADSAKVIFGDRIGHPKFKIGLSAARAILILRELTRTPGRWEEFWSRTTRKDRSEARPDS